MSDHASIFYMLPKGPYMMCYDEDFEKQPGTKRNLYKKQRGVHRQILPRFRAFKPIHIQDDTVMRVIYNPQRSEYSRRPDGYVDRMITIDDDWLAKCSTQFKLAYPQGLSHTMIADFKEPDLF